MKPAATRPPTRARRLARLAARAAGLLLLAEAGTRVATGVGRWIHPPDHAPDPVLGWANPAGVKRQNHFPLYGDVAYSTGPHGFRPHGDPASPRLKILIVGDEVTQARKTTDGRTYADQLGRMLDAEIFAHGAEGHGTLQELLVLEQHVESIRPDLVLVQVCDDDFTANSRALEARSRLNNALRERPYLEGERVVMRLPGRNGLEEALLRHSHLYRQLARLRVTREATRGGAAPEEALIEANPRFVEARDVTLRLLERIRERAGAVPVAAFMACGRPNEPATVVFRDLCARTGIPYLEGVPAAIQLAIQMGAVVNGRPADTHWTDKGNEVAAEALARELRERGLPRGKHAP